MCRVAEVLTVAPTLVAAPPASSAARFFYDGVVFDMDGTLCECAIDFEDMRTRTGIPSGDLFTVMESWTNSQQIKVAMDVILEIEADAAQRVSAKPGLMQLLNMLREHRVHVALVTRNTSASVTAFFDLIGPELASIFSPVLTREFAYVKPDKRLLLHIAQLWNVEPSRLLMVGDSLEDVEVGNAAGTASCLIAGGGNERPGAAPAAPPVGAVPTLSVSGLEELRMQLEQAALLMQQAGQLLLSAASPSEPGDGAHEGDGGRHSRAALGVGPLLLRRVDLTSEDEEGHEAAAAEAAHAVQLACHRVLLRGAAAGRVRGGVALSRNSVDEEAMDMSEQRMTLEQAVALASSASGDEAAMPRSMPVQHGGAGGRARERHAVEAAVVVAQQQALQGKAALLRAGADAAGGTVVLNTTGLVAPISGRMRLGWPALVAAGEPVGAEGAPPPGLQFLDWLVDNGALRPGVCSFPRLGTAAGGLATCRPEEQGDRVLHLCCGQGGLTKMIASQGMKVLGVDVDVAAAQRRGLTAVPFASPRPFTSHSLLAAKAVAGPKAFDIVLLCCEDQEGGCSASPGRHPVLDQWWSGEALRELLGLMHEDSRLCAEVTLPSSYHHGNGAHSGSAATRAGANPARIINSINSSGLTVVAWQLLRSSASSSSCSSALATSTASSSSSSQESCDMMVREMIKLRLVARRHVPAL